MGGIRRFRETLGFAGAIMARRILGLAHVEDFESVADPDRRAACERKALGLARHLMLRADRVADAAQLARLARDAHQEKA